MGRGRVVGGLDNGRKGDWDWGFDIFGERCAALEGVHWACAGGRAMLG